MAKKRLGRPPKPEAEKRQQVGVRTSPELKLRLEETAGLNGRSVAQEAELRLVQSFQEPSHISILLDPLRSLVEAVERNTGGKWNEDFMTWVAVRRATIRLLDTLVPEIPNHIAAQEAESAFKEAASRKWPDDPDEAKAHNEKLSQLMGAFNEALEPKEEAWQQGLAVSEDVLGATSGTARRKA